MYRNLRLTISGVAALVFTVVGLFITVMNVHGDGSLMWVAYVTLLPLFLLTLLIRNIATVLGETFYVVVFFLEFAYCYLLLRAIELIVRKLRP